jgi:hypothetical protein
LVDGRRADDLALKEITEEVKPGRNVAESCGSKRIVLAMMMINSVDNLQFHWY